MKKIFRKILNELGYELQKKKSVENTSKSIKTDKLKLFKTATGDYYLPEDAHQDIIASSIKQNLIFDENIYKTAVRHIKQGTIALDIGSNFGQMAILFSKLVGENGEVHAFEADDFVFSILKKNINLNTKNVISHYGAVHNLAKTTLYFPIQDFEKFGSYGSYGIDYINGKGRPVKTLKIDDLEFDKPISFIKIDIQGGDLFALKGAVKTIEKHQMPIIFEYEYLFEDELNLCFQDYVDFVVSINYKFSKVIDGHNFLIEPK